MKLMSLKQYKKMSKTALMRKITKTLRAMPKAKLALLCYNLTKAKLPRLKVIKRKALTLKEIQKERKRFSEESHPRLRPKRKFSAKQLKAQRLFARRAKAGTLRRRR